MLTSGVLTTRTSTAAIAAVSRQTWTSAPTSSQKLSPLIAPITASTIPSALT